MKLCPLKFRDIFKEKIWGGRQLESLLGKRLPAGQNIGESWEIADHAQDTSIVASGPYAGSSLHDLVVAHGPDLLGSQVSPTPGGAFPLLLKFLDAQDWLSVQVHPDDAYALAHEQGEQGKTEAWYVLSAQRGAALVCGLSHETTAEALASAIENGQLQDHLRHVRVQAGDTLFMPAGRLHTLGPGIVTWEVQENSDVTYRLYDWGRVGATGKPRELHVQDALKVLDLTPTNTPKIPSISIEGEGFRRTFLVACRYFAAELLDVQKTFPDCCDGRTFQVLSVLEGSGVVGSEAGETDLCLGESVLLPASLGVYRIAARPALKLIKSYVPDLRRDIVNPLLQLGHTPSQIAALGGEGKGNDIVPLLAQATPV